MGDVVRKRLRVVLASALACALLLPAVALAAAGLLDSVTYSLPAGWTERKAVAKGTPYGYLALETTSEDVSGGHGNATVMVTYQDHVQYESFDAFRAGTNPDYFAASGGASDSGGQGASAPPISESGVQATSEETTFKGKPAWTTTVDKTTQTPAMGAAAASESRLKDTTYYFNVGSTSVVVLAEIDASGAYVAQFADLEAQTQSVVDSLKFGSPTPAPTSAGGNWRTVVGGLAAIAAAAVAMAGAFLSTPEGRRRAKEDPTMVVGYLLQLSARPLAVAPDRQTPFEASVWKVRANGAYEPAHDAAVALELPPGVAAEPRTGTGSLRAGVWQTGPVARTAVLRVNASAADGATSQPVAVTGTGGAELEVTFEPAEKTSVLGDGKDSVTLVARVRTGDGAAAGPGAGPSAADARASIAIRPLDDWLFGSELVDWGADARATRLMARQADPARGATPPDAVEVEVTATAGDERLRRTVRVGIARQPVLDADPDQVTLEAESGETARVALTVKDPGTARWSYRPQWADDTRQLADTDFSEESASTGTLTLAENGSAGQGGASPKVWTKLTIVASADGYADVERVIDVGVLREGLFAETVSLDPDGTYHVRADGKKNPQTIVFRLYVRDAATGRIVATPAYVNALKFEMLDEPGTTARASAEFSQLAIAFKPEASAAEREPGGAYSFAFTREVPGKGEVRPVRYLVTAPGLDSEKYWCEIKLGLETTQMEPDSPAWQAEYQRADDILKRFMPPAYYPQWKRTLDTRSQFLGVEGMAELRKRIWFNAAELVLAEGAEGYTAEANWADRITKSLEIAELAGDVAFQYLCSIYLGPPAGQAAQIVKPFVLSAIGEYLAGTTPDEWLAMQTAQLGGLLEGRTIDVAAWDKMLPNHRWKLWAAFVCYHFLKTTLYEGKSMMDGFKRAAEQAGGVVVMGWVQKWLHERGGTTPYAAPKAAPTQPKAAKVQPVRDTSAPGTLPKPGKPVRPRVPTTEPRGPRQPDSDAAARIRRATTVGPDGIPMADRAAVLATMRDPVAVRQLKTASPEVQAAFNNTRNQIYREHDAAVLRELRTQPEMRGRRLAVVDVRTPGSDPNSVNTDRDFRVVEVRRDPVTGRTEAIEVDRRAWKESSDRAFARSTGGPARADDAAKWAKDHQQNATDRFHAEASPDLARQGYILDENGQWRQGQIKPNIQLVEEGHGTLRDPEALGKTYETKVREAPAGGEKYVQAGKAVETLTAVRAGYARQGYAVGDLPPRLKQGMAIVGEGKTNFADPHAVAAADAALREAGYHDGIEGFMRTVSSQMESLKWAKKS